MSKSHVPFNLSTVHLPHSLFLTSYILFVLCLKSLLLNVFLSFSVYAAAKTTEEAHIRLELWFDHWHLPFTPFKLMMPNMSTMPVLCLLFL